MKILVVDDEPAVRDAYRHALNRDSGAAASQNLKAMASELFADASEPDLAVKPQNALEVAYFSQGLEAVSATAEQLTDPDRFKVAFIDVRMPPGIDGKETARRIREIDPSINIVIVTAYSDHRITDIMEVAGPANKIMYLKKPFAADEVRHMALSMAAQWDNDARVSEELQRTMCLAENSADIDVLTGAANRVAFQRELKKRAQADRSKLSLLLLDLDNFKAVNETYGHSAGDEVLRNVHYALREACPDNTFVGRLGANDFGILIEGDSNAAAAVCTAAHSACQNSFSVFSNQINVKASAGFIAALEMEEASASDLLLFANIALKSAKNDGQSQMCVFDYAMQSDALFRQTIKTDLAKALEAGELAVHYQQIVDQNTLKIAGFEALVRWNSPEHGSVSPAVFIPIAEEGPLIYDLGEWVLRRALQDCKDWPDQYISVNVSPRQFQGIDLKELFVRCADEAGVPYNRIQIEVTENALFDDPFHSCEVLKSLQLLGFRIALDDFGTGFSNMSRVKTFALDCIKIDKSFVDDLGQQQNALAIVGAMTQLAQSLGLSIVAEGVETAMQFDILGTVGCSHIQGYLFGAAEAIEMANERIAQDVSGETVHPHLTVPQKAG